MAKEVAIGKRAKISQAQQYMLLSVLGAAVVLGIAISLTVHFVQQIIFNAKVIAAEEKSVASYSSVIEKTGICRKPSGSVYSDEELQKCNPDIIETSEIPNTLRSNILEGLAANSALNSVPKEQSSNCINTKTGKNYTYAELQKIYSDAKSASDLISASQLIKSCSALRIIPDALPAFKNEEALMASLNKLFIISNWEPQAISPGGSSGSSQAPGTLNALPLSLSVEADTGTTMSVLRNIERSIRNFNIERANIEWTNEGVLAFRAQAVAYYMTPSTIKETETTIKAEGK